MFGVVPKPLWQRKAPADEANRIQLDTNCLLIEGPEGLLLCDTGFGNKLSKKRRSRSRRRKLEREAEQRQLLDVVK